jgi:hypothetical protein
MCAVRKLANSAALFVLVIFAVGCCTCKVENRGKILLIVKQPDPVSTNVMVPEGAALGFTKIEDGDTLRIVNRFGKEVKATFPPGIIVGSLEVILGKCDEKVVTISIADPTITAVSVFLEGGGKHGGANMIIQPPGGPGG